MSNPSILKSAVNNPAGRTIATFAVVMSLVGFVPHRERGLIDFGANDSQAMSASLAPETAFASLDTTTAASRLLKLVGGTTESQPRRSRFAPGSIRNSSTDPGLANLTANPPVIPLGGSGAAAQAQPDPGAFGASPDGANGSGNNSGGSSPGVGSLPSGGGGGSFTPTASGPPAPPVTGAPVPEPGIWLMMVFGIGLVGTALRRRGKPSGLADVRATSIFRH